MSTQTSRTEESLKRVGRAVVARRYELGMETQQELADAAGVSINATGLFERGKTFPNRVNRIKFENALRWPPGTLNALRRGQEVPKGNDVPTVRALPASTKTATAPNSDPARSDVLALTIATAVAAIAATCTGVLVRERSEQARATLQQLDDQLLQLEALITAALPHLVGSSWNETMSAAAQLHEYREVIRDAARQADKQQVG